MALIRLDRGPIKPPAAPPPPHAHTHTHRRCRSAATEHGEAAAGVRNHRNHLGRAHSADAGGHGLHGDELVFVGWSTRVVNRKSEELSALKDCDWQRSTACSFFIEA